MNTEQATKEIRQMIDREFSHQDHKSPDGTEYIKISKDYLVDMIVKQMEHATATSIAQAIAEERERVVGEIAHREMKYWINVFDSTPVRKIPLEADNIAKNFARIEVARWNKVLANK